jgi:signal transduction histidine kinase
MTMDAVAGDPEHAETRVLRTIVVVFGITTVAFFALTLGTVLAEAPYLQPWWTLVAATVVFGVPPALAVTGRFLRRRTLQVALGGYAIGFLLVVLSFVPAMTVWPMPIDLPPWPLVLTAIGTVAAALAWRPAAVWLYLIANIAAMAPVRYIADGYENLGLAAQDAFFSFAFSAIFTIIASVSVSNARAADRAAAAARAAASRASSAQARVRERARLDALVHDEIMTTFLYATVGTPELDGAVARQARRALDQLHSLGTGGPATIGAVEFASRLRAAVSLSERVSLTVEGTRMAELPSEVVEAFVEAAAEAVRNSLAHAYPGNARGEVAVTLRQSDTGVTVRVADEGVGFQPRLVEAHRLGIRVSIVGRLAVVAGCVAAIDSTPGSGSRVTLSWRQR